MKTQLISPLVETAKKLQKGESLTLDDYVERSLSPIELERLTVCATTDEERMYFYKIAAPVLAEVTSADDRQAILSYIANTEWGSQALFANEDYGSFGTVKALKRKNPYRAACAVIPLPQIIHLSSRSKQKYNEMIDLRKGWGSDDKNNFFVSLTKALKTTEQRDTLIDLLHEIREARGLHLMNVTLGHLPAFLEKYGMERIRERYVDPILNDRPRRGGFDAESIPHSLKALMDLEENLVPLFLQKLTDAYIYINQYDCEKDYGDHILFHREQGYGVMDRSHYSQFSGNRIRDDFASMLRSRLAFVMAVNPSYADPYIETCKIIARDRHFMHCFITSSLVESLKVVSEEDADKVFGLFKGSEKIHHVSYAISSGIRAYPVEGFAGIERRLRLIKKVEITDENIGSWILDEAEIELRHGDEAADNYLEAMKPILWTKPGKGRPLFRKCNHMVKDKKRYSFPALAKEYSQLKFYSCLNQDEQMQALHMLEVADQGFAAEEADRDKRIANLMTAARQLYECLGEECKPFLTGQVQEFTKFIGL